MRDRGERGGLEEAATSNVVKDPTVYVAVSSPDLTYSITRFTHRALRVPAGSKWEERCGHRSEYSRTTFIHEFVNESNCDYLLMLDSDMSPQPDSLLTLLRHGKDVMTGLYFYRGQPPFPVIREDYNARDPGKWPPSPFYDFPKDALFKVGATGFGFLLMHRKVIYETYPLMLVAGRALGGPILPWAYYGYWRGHPSGGDLVLCDLIKTAGFDIWCDSSVFIRHLAPDHIGLEEYDAERARNSQRGKDEV